MPEYTYLLCDLITNEVNLEVPLFGVSYDRKLNSAGNGTFSLNLDRTGYSNEDAIGATVPGKTAIYIDRDGALVWGGIVWSRTYQSQAKVLSMTMQSFESHFYKIGIESTLTYTNKDQRTIVCELILGAQQKGNTNINVLLDPRYPFPSNIVRSVTFPNYDGWSYGRALDYMAEYDDGLDWTIEVFYDENHSPAKRLRCDDVLGASLGNTGLALDYPGNVSNYYYPESCSGGAVSVIGLGAGEGTERLITKASSPDLTDAGYPDYQEFYTNTDISLAATLSGKTKAERDRLRMPITVPTIEIKTGAVSAPTVGDLNIGDYALFSIEDPRFPDGYNGAVRVVGYSAAPPSKDGGPETLSLVLEGQE